jgi:hypothetical protein
MMIAATHEGTYFERAIAFRLEIRSVGKTISDFVASVGGLQWKKSATDQILYIKWPTEEEIPFGWVKNRPKVHPDFTQPYLGYSRVKKNSSMAALVDELPEMPSTWSIYDGIPLEMRVFGKGRGGSTIRLTQGMPPIEWADVDGGTVFFFEIPNYQECIDSYQEGSNATYIFTFDSMPLHDVVIPPEFTFISQKNKNYLIARAELQYEEFLNNQVNVELIDITENQP